HLVKEMLKKADVTVENMAPGTIERPGLGYDEVKKLNPRIIYCSIQGFGAGSKFEKGLAFDMIAQAAGGMISVTGEPDRPPVKPGPSIGDTGTGMLMAITILGTLIERQRTGQGRRLQVAMQDAIWSTQGPVAFTITRAPSVTTCPVSRSRTFTPVRVPRASRTTSSTSA